MKALKAALPMWATAGVLWLQLLSLVAVADWPYPSADHPWDRHDYVNFLFSHKDGNRALPHRRDEVPRRIFDRFVSTENIAVHLRSRRSFDEKQLGLAVILSVVGDMRAAYNLQTLSGEPLQDELVRVQVFALDVLAASVELSPSKLFHDRNDAWRTLALGVVTSLSEADVYSPEQLARLADAMATRYPSIHVVLARQDRRSLLIELQRAADTERNAILREARHRLARVVAQF